MTKRTFRIFLILCWAFFAVTVAAQYFTRPYLPAQLREFIASEHEEALSRGIPASAWAALLVLVFSLVTQVGLFLLKRWARPCYAVSVAFSYIFLPVFGRPNVFTATAYAFASFNAALTGFLLALIYVSPFKALFEQPQSSS